MKNRHLNLLPHFKQEEIYFEKVTYAVGVAITVSTIILLIGVVLQVVVSIFLVQQVDSIDSQIVSLTKSVDETENTALKKEIKAINDVMTDFKNLQNTTPEWAEVIDSISRQIPSGVLIDNLGANLETRAIEISGFAPTRELVIELYNNIKADREHFEDINYPLENVSKPVDVDFYYTFYVKEEFLSPNGLSPQSKAKEEPLPEEDPASKLPGFINKDDVLPKTIE
ncbi:MAG: hypothetical protein R3B41_02625 [Candidatus Doudnabacteria bacterium]